jgi:hypothetical protein
MSYDLAGPMRLPMINSAPIAALLSVWQDYPAVFTRKPIPTDAVTPFAVIGPDISAGNMDGLTARRPMPRRDILIYGDQPTHYRIVEQLGYLVRDLFHRNRLIVQVPGFHVIDIVASGPIVGPTDDDKRLCRIVPLQLRLQQL